MQTWAKHGLRTALVTGGLLMLGTGIASADEDVNPDKPASPLDEAVSVPVHFRNTSVGIKDAGTPDLNRAASTDENAPGTGAAVSQVLQTVFATAAPILDTAREDIAPTPGGARDQDIPFMTRTLPGTGELSRLLGSEPQLDPVSTVDTVVDEVLVPALDGDDGQNQDEQPNIDWDAIPVASATPGTPDASTYTRYDGVLTGAGAVDASGYPVTSPLPYLGSRTGGLVKGTHMAVNKIDGGGATTSGPGDTARGNAMSPRAVPLTRNLPAGPSRVGGPDQATATDSGLISGNLMDGPPAAVVRPPSRVASAVTSKPKATGPADTQRSAGGTATKGLLPSQNLVAPLVSNFPILDVPMALLTQVMTEPGKANGSKIADDEYNIHDLPVGVMKATELPTFTRAARGASRGAGRGTFSGVLPDLTRDIAGIPVQQKLNEVADQLLRSPRASRSDEPQTAPEASRPAPTQAGADPLDTGNLEDTTPVDDVRTLLGGIGLADNLFGGQRATPQSPPVPVPRSVPVPAQAPVSRSVPRPDLGHARPNVQQARFGTVGRTRTKSPMAYMPVFSQNDTTREIPIVPAEVTAILPVIPAGPATTRVPAVNGLGTRRRVDASTLDSTRAALANLFTTHPMG